MIPKSAHELQHELAELHEQNIRIGHELNEVQQEIVRTELQLADARRRKAAQEAQR